MTLLLVVNGLAFGQKPDKKQQRRDDRKQYINQLSRQEEEGTIIFSKQSAFGVKINTDGYGAFYELGKAKSVLTTNLYWLEIGERKHPKEEKHSYVYNATFLGSPYIYGKINNFFFANFGIGQQRLIGGKGN
ncbi:MAG: hypothetical protein JWN76_2798, partial [Chitinophagaceae bacterium]|nr:hypothetical protein [Chitinophagaceae bacterium]